MPGSEKSGQLSFFGKSSNQTQKPTDTLDGFVNEEHYESTQNNDESTESYSGDTSISADIQEYEENDIQTDAEIAPEHNVRPQRVQTSGETPVAVIAPKRKNTFFDFDYHKSIILAFLLYVGGAISRMFRNSFFATLFTAFRQTGARFRDSYLSSLVFNNKTTRLTGRLKKNLRRTATNAFIPALLTNASDALMRVKTRVYGFIPLSFSATSLLLHLFLTPNFTFFKVDLYAPITCVILITASFFLIIHNGTLSNAIKESFILSTLFFGFLGIKRPSYSESESLDISVSGPAIAGVFVAGLTLFFPTHLIAAVFFTAIFTYLVIKYPETGLISLILIIPFVSISILLYIVSIITVSYVSKILTGKRTPDFEFADIFSALFLIFMFLSDFFTFGNGVGAVTSTVFILVYFLCICMLRDKTWFDRAINSVVLTSCVFAAYSVFVTFLGKTLSFDFLEYVSNTDYGDSAASALTSTSILGVTLVVGIFYLLSNFFITKSSSNRFGLLLLLAASIVFVFREASVIIQIGLIIALLLFMILKTNKTFIFIILACAVIPLLPLFNNGIYSGIKTLLIDELYRVNIWSAVFNMLSKYGLTGIGNSTDAFSTLYSSYYVGNSVSVPHAHSMILQIAISLGFVGILLFALIVFFIFQGAFSFGRNSVDKESKNRLNCYAGMCSALALLICSFAENLMYNPRSMLIMWLVFGLTVCARRSAKDLPASAEFLVELDENYNG